MMQQFEIIGGYICVIAVDCAAEYDSLIQCDHCNKMIVEDWQESDN